MTPAVKISTKKQRVRKDWGGVANAGGVGRFGAPAPPGFGAGGGGAV